MTILLPLAILGLISVFIIGGLAWDKKRQSRSVVGKAYSIHKQASS